jgi:hypothetical protein
VLKIHRIIKYNVSFSITLVSRAKYFQNDVYIQHLVIRNKDWNFKMADDEETFEELMRSEIYKNFIECNETILHKPYPMDGKINRFLLFYYLYLHFAS